MLTTEERIAFAGLLRYLVRLDGHFSDEEKKAIDAVASEILTGTTEEGGPYRASTADGSADREAIWDLIDQAGERFEDEDSVRRAAQSVTRQPARETIYGALYEVAAADVISKEEWPLFEWLAKEWDIPW